MIRYDHEFKRLWIFGWRTHHGLLGVALIVAGLALAVHDWKDRAEWIGSHR